ncbi:MAG: hypothetical protein JWN34_4182 [Bryobacterales bacterium]|nr:hypothetical protein [Bryobacterales bacterium]
MNCLENYPVQRVVCYTSSGACLRTPSAVVKNALRRYLYVFVTLITLTPVIALHADAVRTVKFAGPEFDSYTTNPTLAQQQWIRDNFWRVHTYTPYFDTKTSWDANTWFYYDSYAIYRGSSVASQHPEWILKDQGGSQLYIQYDCSGGTCPQYAADIGNPAFRSWWISNVITVMNRGYRGIWIDDVNLEFRVSNGYGTFVAPWDPRTGAVMTFDNWRRYFAEFMEEVRARVPNSAYCSGAPCEITHNSIWYAGPTRTNDAYVKREIAAADYINIERGFNDDGLTGGTGDWSVATLFQFVDTVHNAGRTVNVMDYTPQSDPVRLEYGLAGYFMISGGKDSMTSTGDQDHWWAGYRMDPGTPTSPRYRWNNLWRRDYTGGIVLMNEPNAGSVSVNLPGAFTTVNGASISSLTLGARQGAVLRGASDTTAPVISAITAVPGATSASIAWTTSKASDSQVEFGTAIAYGQSTGVAASPVFNHQVTLSGLAAGTVYNFRVRSKDAAGNVATSGNATLSTTAVLDTIAPVVNSTTPGNAATVPAAGLQISAAFSEAMKTATVNTNTVQLRLQSTLATVAANVTYAANAITVAPSSALAVGVTYSVLVKGGASGVQDAAGNPLAADKVWSFTIAGSAVTPGGTTAINASDLTWVSSTNGWGPAERNTSNGEAAAGDGRPISLNAVKYAKGLGVHAGSSIQYNLSGGGCSIFAATVGIDDEVPAGAGSVVFQVWGDGVKLYESARLVSGNKAVPFSVSVAGRTALVLTVTDSGDGPNYDHADWANPQLTCTGSFTNSAARFVTDLTWASMVNGWGPAERDRSNGEANAGDGRTITLNGTQYQRGLGVHAGSTIHFAMTGCSAFASTVGVDDEVPAGSGSVIFQVWGDGAKLYESPRLVSGNAALPINVDVSGRKDLSLVVTDAGDGNGYDHADWASARLTCTP